MLALSYLRFLFFVSRTSASEEIKKESRFISMEEEEKGKKKALTRIPLQSGGNYPRQTHESTLFSPHWLPPRACVFRSEPHNMRRPTDRCGLSQLGQGKRGGKKTQHTTQTRNEEEETEEEDIVVRPNHRGLSLLSPLAMTGDSLQRRRRRHLIDP